MRTNLAVRERIAYAGAAGLRSRRLGRTRENSLSLCVWVVIYSKRVLETKVYTTQ